MSSLRVDVVTTIRYSVVSEFRVGTMASLASSVVTDHPSETVWRMRIATKLSRRTNLTRRIYSCESEMKNARLHFRGAEMEPYPGPKLRTVDRFTRRDIFGSGDIERIVLLFTLGTLEFNLSFLF